MPGLQAFDPLAQFGNRALLPGDDLLLFRDNRQQGFPARLNQYQSGMCISGVLKTTERTPRRLISPLDPNWVATDSAV